MFLEKEGSKYTVSFVENLIVHLKIHYTMEHNQWQAAKNSQIQRAAGDATGQSFALI